MANLVFNLFARVKRLPGEYSALVIIDKGDGYSAQFAERIPETPQVEGGVEEGDKADRNNGEFAQTGASEPP